MSAPVNQYPTYPARARALRHLLAFGVAMFACSYPFSVAAQEDPGSPETEVEEVVVTGSYIPGTPEDAPSPVIVKTRAVLDSIGNPSILELLRSLGPSSGIDGETNQFQSNGLEGSSNVNLRGLGAGRTLVLMNGSRMAKNPYYIAESGQQFTNTNTIPTIAIDRIEILLDGASATYGSDAVAGVVNFITRSGFRGIEISGGYKNIAESNGDWELGAIFGFGTERLDVVASFGYQFRSELQVRDLDWAIRDYTENTLGTSSIPNPSVFYAVTDTGGFTPTARFDPDCAAVGGLVVPTATGGTGCRFRYVEFDNVSEEEVHWQAFVEATYELNEAWELHVEYHLASDEVPEWKSSPSYPPQSLFGRDRFVGPGMPHFDDFIERNPTLATVFPHGAQVLGRPYGVSGPPQVGHREYLTHRFNIGLSGEIADAYHLMTNLTYGRSDGERITTDLYIDRYAWAYRGLGGPDCDRATGTPGVGNCLYYNPFTSGYAVSQALGAEGTPPGSEDMSLHNDPALREWLLGDNGTEDTTQILVANLVLSGETFALAGGPVGWAAGVQWRREIYDVEPNEVTDLERTPCPYGLAAAGDTYDSAAEVAAGRLAANLNALDYVSTCEGNGPFHFLAGNSPVDNEKQDVASIFLEVGLPILPSLDVQFSLGYEDHSDVGGTLDPKLAVRWQLDPRLALRTSVGTSFRAPGLNQLTGRVTTLQFIAPTSAFKAVDTTGNADLDPEEAVNVNLGLIFEPTDNLFITLDYWRFDFQDPIAIEPFNSIVSLCSDELGSTTSTELGQEACEKITFQNPANQATNQLTRVDVTYENGADVLTSGIDFALNLDVPSSYGAFSVGVSGTYVLEFEVDESKWADAFDALGRLNFTTSYARPLPELKATFYAGWSLAQHAARLELHHTAEYEGTHAGADVAIDSFNTLDLHYNFRFMDGRARVFASIYNLLGEDPPLAPRDLSYDPYTHSPFGRIVKVGMQYKFGS